MKQFKIPCRHEVEGTPTSQELDDYYPLTTQEVIALLETAIAIKDQDQPYAVNEIASIQCRLAQGIPGQVCPRDDDGPTGEKGMLLNEAFVEWIQDPDTLFFKEQPLTESSDIVVVLTNLMK